MPSFTKTALLAPSPLVQLRVIWVAVISVKAILLACKVGAVKYVKPANVAVPPGAVTLTLPVVPPATTAVMLVASTTVNDVAAVPPKLTAVAPVKLVPVMVTVAPLTANVGVKEVMVGAGIMSP